MAADTLEEKPATHQEALSPHYTLPTLRYPYEALEPYIDRETMHLHHRKHHQTYIDNVNKALAPYPQFAGKVIEDIMRQLDQIPEEVRTTVRNNGGGHANHQFFWKVIGPAQNTKPEKKLAESIAKDFGSFENFQEKFTDAATKHFGSGWAFLVINPQTHGLEILTLPNQDSVLLHGRPGLLACDLWEHSYYLKYQNRRAEYLKAWWNVVAWDVVTQRLENFYAGKKQL